MYQGKRVAIITNNLNCERHMQYYSRVEKYFRVNGWTIATDFNVDLVALCACGFHDVMHEKVQKTLKELKKINYAKERIVLLGCLPKTHEPKIKKHFEGVVIPLKSEHKLDHLINAEIALKDVQVSNVFNLPKESKAVVAKELFYIKISDGCLRKCTFCVINKAKGSIKSIPKEEIIEQYKTALSCGKRKIFLMGDDTFAYGVDTGKENIIDLVHSLLEIDSDVELHFGALHIKWFKLYAKEILSLCKQGIVKQLNIGLQHVNDYLLARMGRETAFFELYEIICSIREECPDVSLEADIMVGFPGETREMFDELVEFFRKDKCFNNVRHFSYSDVEGAPSCAFEDKVPEIEKLDRWNYLKEHVLGERSVYNRNNQEDHATIAFQLTLDKESFFCKNSYNDEFGIENLKKKLADQSVLLSEERGEFGF